MGYSEEFNRETEGTFVLKLKDYCLCLGGCVPLLRKLVKGIPGVNSISIDAEKRHATISGTVDPAKVLEVLRDDKPKKTVELISVEKDSPPPPTTRNNKQDQVVQKQKPVLNRSKVAHDPDVALKALEEPIVNTIQHFHYTKQPHKLELKSYNKLFSCDGCKEEGFGSRYRCNLCGYELHEECMHPKPTISLKHFKGSTFDFRYQSNGRGCDVCGMKIFGFSYHCKAKGFYLHPRCSNLERTLCIGGTDFVLHDKVQKKCLWCKKKIPGSLEEKGIPGWCYVSECNKFYCHVHCVMKIAHEAWKRGDLNGPKHDGEDDMSMALENVDLQLVEKLNRSGGGGGGIKFAKKIGILIRTIVGILIGDPTVVVLSLIFQAIPT